MNIISVSNVQHDKSASNTFHRIPAAILRNLIFTNLSGLVVKPPPLLLSRRGFDRLLSVAVIRAAKSKRIKAEAGGGDFGISPFFLSSLLSSG